MRYLIGILLLLTLVPIGCNRKPDKVLSEDKMVDLLTDIQLAQAYYNTTPVKMGKPDREAMIQGILDEKGITREEMDSSMAYYGRNIDDYYALFDKVEKKLKERSHKLNNDQEKNVDDIWPYASFAVLLPNQETDGLSFSFPAGEIDKGSTLSWKFRLSSPEPTDMMLGVEYTNGLKSLATKKYSTERSMTIDLQTDTALVIKRIFGVMTVPENSIPVWIDSIGLLRNDFDSLKYSKIRGHKKISLPVAKKDTITETSDSIR